MDAGGAMHWEEEDNSVLGGQLGGELGGEHAGDRPRWMLEEQCIGRRRTVVCGLGPQPLRLPTVAANGPVRPHRQKHPRAENMILSQ